jgi:hypothetical protein
LCSARASENAFPRFLAQAPDVAVGRIHAVKLLDCIVQETLSEHRLWKECAGHEYLTSSVSKITQLNDKIAEVERAVQKRLLYEAA